MVSAIDVGGGIAVRTVVVGRGNIGPVSVESVVGVSQTMVAKGAIVSISISLRLSISRPLAQVPVGTIVVGVGGGVAKRPGVGRGNIGPVSIESVVGVSQTVVAKGAVVSISISISLGLRLSISRPLAKVPVGTIGVGTGIFIRPDAKGIRGSIGPQSVVGVSQTMVAEG